MGNLSKETEDGSKDWSTGFAPFWDSGQSAAKVLVKCKINDLNVVETARLDTGSTYTVVSNELVQIIDSELVEIGKGQLETWEGQIKGKLVKLNITLLAEGGGSDLLVEEALVLVSENYGGPVVLGYRGFLDKIRIAIDLGVRNGEQIWYFGLCE